MKTKPMASFVLRTDKERKDKTCPIYFVVRIQGVNYKFPTDYYARKSEWIGNAKLSKNPNLNYNLNKKLREFEDWVYKNDRDGIPTTIEAVKAYQAGNSHADFYAYYENKIEELKTKVVANTIKGYRSNINVLKKFKERVNINGIDLNFINAFDNYLRLTRKISDAGRFSHHKNLRAILRMATKEKKLKEMPYAYFKVPKVAPKKVWLNEGELKKVIEHSIPAKKTGMINAQEFLAFASYTGMRYSDIVDLKPEHLRVRNGKWFIEKICVKTKEKMLAPCPPKARAILKAKGKLKKGESYFKISNQTLNHHLTKLGNLVEIGKKITSHIGRRTFGSIAVNKGKNIYAVSAALGHKSVAMTEKYYTELDSDSIYSVVE